MSCLTVNWPAGNGLSDLRWMPLGSCDSGNERGPGADYLARSLGELSRASDVVGVRGGGRCGSERGRPRIAGPPERGDLESVRFSEPGAIFRVLATGPRALEMILISIISCRVVIISFSESVDKTYNLRSLPWVRRASFPESCSPGRVHATQSRRRRRCRWPGGGICETASEGGRADLTQHYFRGIIFL